MGETNCWSGGESTNCWSGGRESRLIVVGESGSGGWESRLIVGVGDGRVD